MDTNNNTIVTQNGKMLEILKDLERIATSDYSVLLIGESGVGKELFAEYLHRKSKRKQEPFEKLHLLLYHRICLRVNYLVLKKARLRVRLMKGKGYLKWLIMEQYF
ncbi:MAG: sigma 54-interacting transcriptional regulator [Ignavibacteria bacterium]|nr:sigma 54-interacting transcriptional regulator [Ignavibacteria bacterium]